MEDARRCPRCNSEYTVPIVYGLPGAELVEESKAGRVALGGCVVFPDAPDYTCRNCGHEWREDETGS
jgi:DNA-directed RNA polymerase subunit RPC12/RpoP